MSNKKVLVLAGGGCFGISSITFLRSVLFNNINNIDCIAGTSIGSIMAIYLALGGSADDLYTDFKIEASKIFASPSIFRKMNAWSSKYSSEQIETELKKILPGKFGDLKTKILVPSLNFKENKPKIFDNIVRDDDCELMNWQIARASSAAPTYFEPYSTDGNNILLDGGLVENIPIATATASLKHLLGWDYEQMDVFAIGTGIKPNGKKYLKDVASYSAIGWLKNLLIPYTTLGNEMITDFRSQLMDYHSYMYFNPVQLEDDWDMDDYSLIDDNIIEDRCKPYLNDFKINWDKFMSNKQIGSRNFLRK